MHSLRRLSLLSPRTILIGGASAGVLLGAVLASMTPTTMVFAPDPPWKASLPARIGETAWVPTASAPEDPAPRFADGYAYTAAGWSFPPALRVEWRQPQSEPYPVPVYDSPAADEPAIAAEPAPEAERTAREDAQAAAAVTERTEAQAEERVPAEAELIPVEIDT